MSVGRSSTAAGVRVACVGEMPSFRVAATSGSHRADLQPDVIDDGFRQALGDFAHGRASTAWARRNGWRRSAWTTLTRSRSFASRARSTLSIRCEPSTNDVYAGQHMVGVAARSRGMLKASGRRRVLCQVDGCRPEHPGRPAARKVATRGETERHRGPTTTFSMFKGDLRFGEALTRLRQESSSGRAGCRV